MDGYPGFCLDGWFTRMESHVILKPLFGQLKGKKLWRGVAARLVFAESQELLKKTALKMPQKGFLKP